MGEISHTLEAQEHANEQKDPHLHHDNMNEQINREEGRRKPYKGRAWWW